MTQELIKAIQDEDIEIDSVNELVEKFNNYGKD